MILTKTAAKKTLNHQVVDMVQDDNSLVSLPCDVIGKIMEYADPFTLLNIACSSKSVASLLTYGTVVHTASMSGYSFSKNLTSVYNLLKRECIHTPSVMRLLRIVNGNKCEFCMENYVDNVNEFYGVFICETCCDSNNPGFVATYTKCGHRYTVAKELIDYLLGDGWITVVRDGYRRVSHGDEEEEHSRALSLDIPLKWVTSDTGVETLLVKDLHNMVWKSPTSNGYGEMVGPVLCSTHLAELTRMLPANSANDWGELFTRYFYREAHGPSLDQVARREIITAYVGSREPARLRALYLEWKLQTEYMEYVMVRRIKAVEFIKTLKGYINNPSLCDAVFHYGVKFNEERYMYSHPLHSCPLDFCHHWMEELLEEPMKQMHTFDERKFKMLARRVKAEAVKNLPYTEPPEPNQYFIRRIYDHL